LALIFLHFFAHKSLVFLPFLSYYSRVASLKQTHHLQYTHYRIETRKTIDIPSRSISAKASIEESADNSIGDSTGNSTEESLEERRRTAGHPL
jgi:hypothetical protein